MAKYRTIIQCFNHLKENDFESAITPYLLRCIAKSGDVLTLKTGNKILIDLDSLHKYLNNSSE